MRKWIRLMACLSICSFSAAFAGGPGPYMPAPGFLPAEGFYINGNIGLATFYSYDAHTFQTVGGILVESWGTVSQENSMELTGGAAVGYTLPSAGFAGDISYQYFRFRTRDFSTSTGTALPLGGNTNSGGGRVRSDVVMANVYYFFARLFGADSHVMPYLGVGVGISWNKLTERVNSSNTVPSVTSILEGRQLTEFAWRAMFGIHYYFTNNIFVDFRYSYENLGDVDYGDDIRNTQGALLGTIQGGEKIQVRANSFTVGITNIFNS